MKKVFQGIMIIYEIGKNSYSTNETEVKVFSFVTIPPGILFRPFISLQKRGSINTVWVPVSNWTMPVSKIRS